MATQKEYVMLRCITASMADSKLSKDTLKDQLQYIKADDIERIGRYGLAVKEFETYMVPCDVKGHKSLIENSWVTLQQALDEVM